VRVECGGEGIVGNVCVDSEEVMVVSMGVGVRVGGGVGLRNRG